MASSIPYASLAESFEHPNSTMPRSKKRPWRWLGQSAPFRSTLEQRRWMSLQIIPSDLHPIHAEQQQGTDSMESRTSAVLAQRETQTRKGQSLIGSSEPILCDRVHTQRRQSGLKSGGSRGSGSKNFDFLGKFPKNFDFFQAISQAKNRFFRANFRKISIFSCNFTKDSDFQGKFMKNFNFLR